MGQLSDRERRLACLFYFCSGIATLLWWAVLWLLPESRPFFLGKSFADSFTWILLIPDTISALVISTWMLVLIRKNSPLAVSVAWMHVGGQGYAWAIALALAYIDPQAYWGVVGMTFSAGCALAFAIRLQGLSVLWGKFRFFPAPNRTPLQHWHRTLIQIVCMWFVFYVAIPTTIVLTEYLSGTHIYWLQTSWQLPIGVALFSIAGAIGIWTGYIFSRYGEGTPLPSDQTKRFVIIGPYRCIRNPMAFSSMVQGGAIGLAIGSPLVVTYTVIGGIWWEVLVRWQEEADLESRFGESYDKYRSEIRCWLPTFKSAIPQVFDSDQTD